jgi:hypothetical protein
MRAVRAVAAVLARGASAPVGGGDRDVGVLASARRDRVVLRREHAGGVALEGGQVVFEVAVLYGHRGLVAPS